MISKETLVTYDVKRYFLKCGGTYTVESKFNPLEEYWIAKAKQVLMALPSSGQLSLSDIQTEQGGSGQASLRSMSSTAGFSTPDNISDFYGWSAWVSSDVRWEYPEINGDNTLSGQPQRRIGTGSWTNFFSDVRDTSVTASTVGYRMTIIHGCTSGGGAFIDCGPNSGDNDYGGTGGGDFCNTVTYTLDGVTTNGRDDMFFVGITS